ncbi:MAG TPA: hypothetical protein VGP22_06315, partial [Albitalea sp.]|nr:hypothetical protein [Albitalea sp.]
MPASRSRSTFTRPAPRMARLALGIALGLAFTAGVRAQSLFELYEAARSFDAPYLAARAAADSAVYRAEAAHGTRRPQAALTASASRDTRDADGDSTTR